MRDGKGEEEENLGNCMGLEEKIFCCTLLYSVLFCMDISDHNQS